MGRFVTDPPARRYAYPKGLGAPLTPEKPILPFLGHAYNYKSLSGYEVGPLAKSYAGDALDTIQKATRFVDCIAARL